LAATLLEKGVSSIYMIGFVFETKGSKHIKQVGKLAGYIAVTGKHKHGETQAQHRSHSFSKLAGKFDPCETGMHSVQHAKHIGPITLVVHSILSLFTMASRSW